MNRKFNNRNPNKLISQSLQSLRLLKFQSLLKMNNELEIRIDALLKKFVNPAFPEDIEEINKWKEEAKRAMLAKDIKNHEGIKLIVKRFASDVEGINLLLLNANSEKLSDKERDRLLDKKFLYIEFLSIFPEAEKILKEIEKKVAENEGNEELE